MGNFTTLALFVAMTASAALAHAEPTAWCPDAVIDGVSAESLKDYAVVVEGERIVAV